MKQLNLSTVQNRITIIWLAFAAIMFVRMIFLTSDSAELSDIAWSWYATSILPASGLIVGLWISLARNTNYAHQVISKMSANLAVAFVCFYIFCIVLAMFIANIFGNTSHEAYFTSTQHWLSYIQTPMLALLGKVFTDGSNETPAQAAQNL